MSTSLVVIKPSSLGDVVHGLAVVPPLRAHMPGIRIGWVVNEEYAGLVRAAGVDEVHVFPRQAWKKGASVPRGAWSTVQLCKNLLRARYDIALDLQGLLRSGLFTYITRAPQRIGFSDARECAALAYTTRVSVKRAEHHAVQWCLDALAPLLPVPARAVWEWPAADTDDVHARFGSAPGGYCLFVVRARWKTKTIPLATLAAAAARTIATYGVTVLFVGGAGDKAYAEDVCQQTQACGAPRDRFRSLAGETSLTDILALSRDSMCVVTPDTGVMHLAVAAGARVVAVMGATRTETHGPYGQSAHVVRGTFSCPPCHRRVCRHASSTPQCLASVAPEEIVAMIEQVVNNTQTD